MERRQVISALAASVFTLASGGAARAQGRTAPRRIGFLTAGSVAAQAPLLKAFRQALVDRRYLEGADFSLETRFADGDFSRLPSLARELVALQPDVLLVNSTPANLVAKAATRTIPIVFVGVADPVGVKLVASLARPEGNITGITNVVAELVGKRLEILTEILPEARRIAVLVNRKDQNSSVQIANAEAAALRLNVALGPILDVGNKDALAPAIRAAVKSGAAGALRMVDPTATMYRRQTVQLANQERLPVMYAFREDVEAGGLACYGTSLPHQYAQAAGFVDRILRGTKPADLPVEQPTRFEFALNRRTASQLGIQFPQELLLRADVVIE